ncbi:MAG: haloacid dehalogenase-like hydrolase [Luteimonas sp.]
MSETNAAISAANARAGSRYPTPRPDAPLVVFDFDHTLYDGDSGAHLFKWLLQRNPLRMAAALLATPILGPMVACLPTRRWGISGYVWLGTIGFHRRRDLDLLINRYVGRHADALRARLLPIALDVLHHHLAAGDRVVIATGAPPQLAREILRFVAHETVPVVGTRVGPRFGAVMASRHCHAQEKVRMIRDAGYVGAIASAYSDSSADLPLLLSAATPVVVNPKRGDVAMFRRVLPPGTPILNWGCADRGGESVSVAST